jgi:hypothetical protein
MPHVVCPRCQRANPNEAVYCHFDGVVLRQGAAAASMAIEFVFPSGRRCRNFDDLVQGCQYEWEDARDLVRKGAFAKFLAGVGRMDLVRAAQEAQSHRDPDIGLHNFINCLPVSQVQGPKLDLNPRRLNLGALRAGETRQIRLSIVNQGKGLLQGKITVAEGTDWLRIVEADLEGRCALKTARDQQVTLRIDTRGLPAPQSYSGKLTVITNGGITEVPIRMDVGAVPFPRPPFVGVSSPREMAERMRAQPKQAVALLESGDVQKWFLANGWAYPVVGPTARGVAAVQQFFEGMGLSKPPPLTLSERTLRISCVPPEAVRAQVTLSTAVKKWVYAQVESDVPWMQVLTPDVSGAQRADVIFEIDSTLADPGLHEGNLVFVANAGQRLSLSVSLEIMPPHEPFTRRLLKPFFMGFLLVLVYRLLLVGPADLFARSAAARKDTSMPTGSLAAWLQSPLFGDNVRLEFVRSFVLATWWIGALAGAVLLWQRGSRRADVLSGAVAGAGVGLAGAATLACLMDAADSLPRAVLRGLSGLLKSAEGGGSAWLGTLLWVLIAALCWGLIGGVAGFVLRFAGKPGSLLLAYAAAPIVWLLQTCGLKGWAGLLES